jgi:hypothetical protein
MPFPEQHCPEPPDHPLARQGDPEPGRGNVVFNAATIYWPEALSEPPGYLRPSEYLPRHGPDPRVQAITRNVLGRFTESPRLRDHAP